jgi:hypothetical protein
MDWVLCAFRALTRHDTEPRSSIAAWYREEATASNRSGLVLWCKIYCAVENQATVIVTALFEAFNVEVVPWIRS